MKIITIKFNNSQKNYTYLLRKDSISISKNTILKVPRGTDNIYYSAAYIIAVQDIMELPEKVTSWLLIKPDAIISSGILTQNIKERIQNELKKQKKENFGEYKNNLIKKINCITFKIQDLFKLWEETPKTNTDKLEDICMKIASLEDEREAIYKKLNIVYKD